MFPGRGNTFFARHSRLPLRGRPASAAREYPSARHRIEQAPVETESAKEAGSRASKDILLDIGGGLLLQFSSPAMGKETTAGSGVSFHRYLLSTCTSNDRLPLMHRRLRS